MVHITFSLKVIASHFQCSYIDLKFVGFCVCVYACMFCAHPLCAHPQVFHANGSHPPWLLNICFLTGTCGLLIRIVSSRDLHLLGSGIRNVHQLAWIWFGFVLNVCGCFPWLHVFAPVCREQKMFVGIPVSDGNWAWILYKSRKYSQVLQLHNWIYVWHSVFWWRCNVCENSHDLPTELGSSHLGLTCCKQRTHML